jgi:hypothetical protein
MDYLQRLQNLEKKINENKVTKAKLEQKAEQLQEEYKKLLTELEAQGVKEGELGQTILNMENDIEEAIAEAENSLK